MANETLSDIIRRKILFSLEAGNSYSQYRNGKCGNNVIKSWKEVSISVTIQSNLLESMFVQVSFKCSDFMDVFGNLIYKVYSLIIFYLDYLQSF